MESNKRVLATVKWRIILLPTELAVLGVDNILQRNMSLLFKWWRHFSNVSGSLWKDVICYVHGLKGHKASANQFPRCEDAFRSQFNNSNGDMVKIRDIVDESLVNTSRNGKSI